MSAPQALNNIKQVNTFELNRSLKDNNFDLLRFIFAFIVFLVHAYALSGVKELKILSEIFSSEIAVKSFFVISGFLIFMSYESSSNTKNFFIKRARRLYPAYIFIILVSIGLGSFFSSHPWHDYLTLATLKYMVVNLLFLNFLQPNLPGLFDNNIFQAVNGALWTLKIEVMFYLIVPFVVLLFRKCGRMRTIITLYFLSIIYSVIMSELAKSTGHNYYYELQRQLPGQLTYFIVGAVGYYYFKYFVKYGAWLVGIALFVLLFKAQLPWFIVEPIGLGVLVLYFACIFPQLGDFGKYGDFSYGIYIIHFPVLQLFVSLGFFSTSPWVVLCSISSLIVFLAYLLWHSVEKHFLSKSSHNLIVANG